MQAQNKNAKHNLIKTIFVCIMVIVLSATIVMATETDDTCLVPADNQYFELRAVQVKDVEGQNKQLIMELWGNNIEFKRI